MAGLLTSITTPFRRNNTITITTQALAQHQRLVDRTEITARLTQPVSGVNGLRGIDVTSKNIVHTGFAMAMLVCGTRCD